MGTHEHRQESFAVGEIAPNLHRQFGLEHYAKSARTLRNFIVSKYGTAMTRPGTKYVGEVTDSTKLTRLFTFDLADNAAYGLEIGTLIPHPTIP